VVVLEIQAVTVVVGLFSDIECVNGFLLSSRSRVTDYVCPNNTSHIFNPPVVKKASSNVNKCYFHEFRKNVCM